MPSYFLDSSAIVKRYVLEAGSVWVADVMSLSAENVIHAVSITEVEVVAALTRRARAGSIDPAAARRLIARFRSDFNDYVQTVEVTSKLLSSAVHVAEDRGLRGYDAVQLAGALAVNREAADLGLATTLVSADAELNAAAAAEGLAVEDPNRHA